MCCALVLAISPSRSSVPTPRISARTLRSPTAEQGRGAHEVLRARNDGQRKRDAQCAAFDDAPRRPLNGKDVKEDGEKLGTGLELAGDARGKTPSSARREPPEG